VAASFSKANGPCYNEGKTEGKAAGLANEGSGELGGTGGIWRAIDASANRAGEALRVLEDVLRFGLDDHHLTRIAKDLRHDLAAVLARDGLERRIAARDVTGDVGAGMEPEAGLARGDDAGLVAANAARGQQALRSLQECAAVVAPGAVAGFEAIRYRLYALERSAAAAARSRRRLAGVDLCVLVDGGPDEPAFARLVSGLVGAGVRMFQVRDKALPVPDLLARVRRALAICKEIDASDRPLVVVNDRADVAAAAGADGVHVGAADLPVVAARRVLGPGPLVGRTAHDVAEARAAVDDAADYLGIGPCFPSSTKAFADHARPEFLREVCSTVALPVFAIGGITFARLEPLVALGVRRVAVASAVTGAADPPRAAREILDELRRLTGRASEERPHEAATT
jgi:thiamine-phosphate pyrophosphorylase